MIDYIELMIQRQKRTKTKEYLDWLVEFIEKQDKKYFNDENILYDDTIDVSDRENGKILSYFFSNITEKADAQSIFCDDQKDEESFFFCYKEKFYEIWTIYGQGAITGIRLLETPIEDNYIILDRELTDEEKKEKELIEYIVVNKDLNMSTGKIAAQVGHVCGMCAESLSSTHKYKIWKEKHDFKKIVLAGHQKDLLKLEKEGFFAVRDKGYTEIPENSLTAVSLGIMTRKEAQKYIKRLQIFK